jgi:dTDP-glucose pyrophosphorylase
MISNEKYLIPVTASIKEALQKLNQLSKNLTIFVVDEKQTALGTVTDGDIRRALIKGLDLDAPVHDIMNKSFHFINKFNFNLAQIDEIREIGIKLIPIIDNNKKLLRIVDLSEKISLLPLDAVIMAGGQGRRLRPLTETIPKPLLKIGLKTIIDYNIDRLANYGIENIHISVNYLGQMIQDHCKDGSDRNLNLQYIIEHNALGTIGAVSKISNLQYNDILVMNSDLLTNIDFEDFYKEFIASCADMAIASVPYTVSVPYAVLETNGGNVLSFKEKPSYTYYSSAGIYLIKRQTIDLIPKDEFYHATDLIEKLILLKKKVIYYPLLGYWLDIGRHADLEKAKEDIKHIQF